MDSLKVGPMKKLYKYYTPTSINFGGGVPMDAVFPIKKTNMFYHNENGEEASYTLENSSTLLQNYQRGDGLVKLKEWFQEHTAEVHSKNDADFGCCATVGSTDAYGKVLQLVDTDVVVFDKYAYGTAVSATRAFGKQTLGIDTDEYGMIPEALEASVLLARSEGHKVNLVYLIPVAQNPTGVTIPRGRLWKLYEVCKKLDLIIVEDDAYYYLHFENESGSGEAKANDALPGKAGLPTSLFNLDTDGRVIRFDSLSKFVAPGMRLGWVSGPRDFTDKYQLLQEITSQFPSGISQSAFVGLLKAWGNGGFDAHLKQVGLAWSSA
jgi:aromatic amino acid aminotransferase I